MPDEIEDYGEEEKFIQTVEDDIIDNKYSYTEEDAPKETFEEEEAEEMKDEEALSVSGSTIKSNSNSLNKEAMSVNISIPVKSNNLAKA